MILEALGKDGSMDDNLSYQIMCHQLAAPISEFQLVIDKFFIILSTKIWGSIFNMC